MGRLIKLELENFKSYSGKQTVGPFDNFTCIIGPNGAGKSNMMDAISFVLGVQSKHLRSSHLKELIFRKDVNSPPARHASVKLFYEVSDNEIDNRSSGSVIEFLRSINSAGVADYHIDNKKVTYAVYENLLQQIGVLVKARNFLVFQGDVETVASKSPMELTKLLEQISGSDSLAEEYEDLRRRRDQAEESTILSMQRRKMYVTQCKEVKGQKDEAEFFLQKQAELADVKTEHILWQLWGIQQDVLQHKAAVDELSAEMVACEQSEADVEEELQQGKAELAGVNKALAAAEKVYGKADKLLEAEKPRLGEVRAKMKGLAKRAADLERSEGKVQKDLEQQSETVAGLQTDIRRWTETEARLKAGIDAAADSSVRLGAEERAEYSKLREEVAARSAANHAMELTVETELRSKQQQLQGLERQEAALRVEQAAGTKLTEEYSERSDKLREAARANKAEEEALLREREQCRADVGQTESRLQALRAQLEEVSGQLREAGNEKRRSKQEERVAEAVAAMQSQFKGVHGKLVDLCRPVNKKYGKAITIAAGRQMDAIVCDSRETAAECMRYLKEQRVGVCQFLPLDNISAPPVSDALRGFGPGYRPCIDLVECEERFQPALLYAVGSTVVCDTLKLAQNLCFARKVEVKAVTLDGHVISKSGAMTGGSASGGSGHEGGGGHRAWDVADETKKRQKLAEVAAAIAQLEQSGASRERLLDLDARLRAVKVRLEFNDAELQVVAQKLAQSQQQERLRDESMRKLAKEAASVRVEVARLEKQLAALQERIREVEAEVFGDFSSRVGVANIRDYEEQGLRRHQEQQQQHAAASKSLASLAAQLEYELKRDFQGTLARVRSQLAEAREESAALEEQEQSVLQRELQLRSAAKAALEKVQAVKEQRLQVNASMAAAHEKRAKCLGAKDALSKKRGAEDSLLQRGRSQLRDVLQRALIDEVALPTVEGRGAGAGGDGSGADSSTQGGEESDQTDDSRVPWSGNKSQSEQFRGESRAGHGRRGGGASGTEDEESEGETGSGSRASSRSTHFSQSMDSAVLGDQRKVAEVDFSSLKKYKNYSKSKVAERDAQLARRIADLLAELETIQPNMHAAERYEGVVEKLGECTRELDDLRGAANDVNARFEEVRKRRQSLYQDCYAHVSQSLGTIYRDLTRSSKHPLGGNAYLTLDNTDEPYLGGIRFTAMPPMKRFRDMDQLSGGEKTMAALALLFSLHSYRQAPFFVLDEVDAALDNVNVKKICNYIKQRSRDFQCVVISLKDMFFEHAECLVGICKDVAALSSQVLTLDLKQYAPGTASGSNGDDGHRQSGSEVEDDESYAWSSQAGTPVRGSKHTPALSSIHGSGDHTPSSVRSAGGPSSGRGLFSGGGSEEGSAGARRSLGKRRSAGSDGAPDKGTSAVKKQGQLFQQTILEEGEYEDEE